MTIRDTKKKIIAEPHWWKIAFFDFVDAFRRDKSLTAIAEPFELNNDQTDALLASTCEFLCDEMKIDAPVWLREIPACREPYFVAGFENLKATAIVESPLRFRIRKVFVTASFLSRI